MNAIAPRRPSMELRSIAKSVSDNRTPPPANITMREWFAGLALGNSELMKEIPVHLRPVEAVRLADEMMSALMKPKVPTLESMAAPSEEEMQRWDAAVAEKKAEAEKEKEVAEARGRQTMPAKRVPRKPTLVGVAPASVLSQLPPPVPTTMGVRKQPVDGSYCIVNPK